MKILDTRALTYLRVRVKCKKIQDRVTGKVERKWAHALTRGWFWIYRIVVLVLSTRLKACQNCFWCSRRYHVTYTMLWLSLPPRRSASQKMWAFNFKLYQLISSASCLTVGRSINFDWISSHACIQWIIDRSCCACSALIPIRRNQL